MTVIRTIITHPKIILTVKTDGADTVTDRMMHEAMLALEMDINNHPGLNISNETFVAFRCHMREGKND